VNSIAPKSPFFKGGLYQQFLVVPPFSSRRAGGIIMPPKTEKILAIALKTFSGLGEGLGA
jgi:hypothetical protein